ncbi:LysR substrate-binding domain-containing protein [Insolitispirillum peregrinum]|uniref:LysR family transcriptional regulator, hca operon transcriptional activator n=1 Tax=Insolitispirillum peregrinum TaxID=80876 RepID=A0A1N7NBT5_9PROT|nr:LysR substrate-binding domain-containing protein [Insolitispirillum peregrinum]SIS95827.1 LysR family transcriptional regulator, hca operon transcriptional activator [Insolitispirillum peregrinum]
MELRHLRYFVAVAEELNFTRAAERLRTAQPSLSQQIRDLEDEVGTPLFVRTKRRVELTAAGAVFLDEARLVLAQSQRAISLARRTAQTEGGTLTIGFVPAAEVKIFPNMLTAMRARFPNLQLVLRSLTTAEQRTALLDHSIDVAFMRLPADDVRLSLEVVLQEKIEIALPATHPLAAQDTISVHQLTDVPFLHIAPLHAGSLHGVIESFLAEHNISLRPQQEVENVLTLLTLISMNEGFSFLPDYAHRLLFRNVVGRPLREQSPTVGLAMVWRTTDQSPELMTFLDLVRQSLTMATD